MKINMKTPKMIKGENNADETKKVSNNVKPKEIKIPSELKTPKKPRKKKRKDDELQLPKPQKKKREKAVNEAASGNSENSKIKTKKIKAENSDKVKKEKSAQQKRREKGILLKVLLVAGLTIILIVAGFSIYKIDQQKKNAELEAQLALEQENLEKQQQELEAQELLAKQNDAQKQELNEVIMPGVISGGAAFRGLEDRPAVVELTSENTANFARIESAFYDKSTGTVNVSVKSEGIPASDDKYYYLFYQPIYESSMDTSECLGKVLKSDDTVIPASVKLYSKYRVAVKKNGEYIAISSGKYLSNPEDTAGKATGRNAASKKGLLVNPAKLHSGELEDLGVKQSAYNIPLSRILGGTTNGIYPTISYNYNGKTYHFNGQTMAEYDLVFSSLSAKGIINSAIILDDRPGAYPELTHPDARSGGSANYAMFNGKEQAGVELIAAVGAFLADRYSGNGHGTISNFIIGNEVNARKEWNYMPLIDNDSYARVYADAFRVFYNAIRSRNAGAMVYISLDQQWNRNATSKTGDYDAKDLLESFNSYICSEGNIDYGVAYHPYNVPLTSGKSWVTSKYVVDSMDSPYLSMRNIYVLTNLLSQQSMLDTEGNVRSVLLSELGYSSTNGQEMQAAGFVYAYKVAEANPHIDGILLNRETDAYEEIAQGLALGITDPGGGHKYIYNVFKYIDTPQADNYTAFAKSIMGVSSFGELIRTQ